MLKLVSLIMVQYFGKTIVMFILQRVKLTKLISVFCHGFTIYLVHVIIIVIYMLKNIIFPSPKNEFFNLYVYSDP